MQFSTLPRLFSLLFEIVIMISGPEALRQIAGIRRGDSCNADVCVLSVYLPTVLFVAAVIYVSIMHFAWRVQYKSEANSLFCTSMH